MNSLGVKGRRSTPILRSLSFNIGRSTEVLQLKQAADVLFACAALNFPDEVRLIVVSFRAFYFSCLNSFNSFYIGFTSQSYRRYYFFSENE